MMHQALVVRARPRAWNTCERTFNFVDRPDGPNGSSSSPLFLGGSLITSILPALFFSSRPREDLSTLRRSR